VYEYEKRLDKRLMTDKSGRSVYIGAPRVFAEWIGCSVEKLLADPDKEEVTVDSAEDDTDGDSNDAESDDAESTGFLERLFG
jgi:hypothetical protein